jgi:hypothetical protein
MPMGEIVLFAINSARVGVIRNLIVTFKFLLAGIVVT